MLILLIVIWLLTLLYLVLILIYSRGWTLQNDFVNDAGFIPKTKVSVVIPARNEERNIGACIASILTNDYPQELLEIIVVDDHSSDGTFDVVNTFNNGNVRCLRLQDFLEGKQLNSYKKKALETAIAQSSSELIITTDADCTVPEMWLKHIASLYEQQRPVMIVAPVAFTTNGNIVQTFQSLDFMTMQGITAAAHRLKMGNMSNGANLAFSREAFYLVEGYKGVDHLASGDDYLLMMKLGKRFPARISYLKSTEAIVQTKPQPDWKSFFNQRIRWASKSGKYDDKKMTFTLILVYLFNLSFALLFIAGFSDQLFWLLGAGVLLLKIAVELYFLLPVAAFFGKTKELIIFPFLQPLHIAYIICAGFLGFVGKYQWKGRSIR